MKVTRFCYGFRPLRHQFATPLALGGRAKTPRCRSARGFQSSYKSANVGSKSPSENQISIRKSARWWDRYSDVLFTGKTWIFLGVIFCLSELGQGYYIGYHKELNWLSHHQYTRAFGDDDDDDLISNGGTDVEPDLANGRGYSPLRTSREIRLLLLRPGAPDDKIEVELQRANMAKRPDYEALSYVWGSEQAVSPIMLAGKSMPIGQNLMDALHRLRLPDETRILWIDALCIDQQKPEEKAQQVQLMGDIYSEARRVLIWLGNDDTIEDGLRKLTSRKSDTKYVDWSPLEPIFTDPLFYGGQRFLVWLGFHSVDKAGVANLQPHQYSGEFDWADLIPVIKSQWFSRIWCVQELVMAKRLVIVTKTSETPWDNFAYAVNEMRDKFTIYKAMNPEAGTSELENFYVLHDMRTRYKQKRKQKHTILDLLFLTRGFHATDPRDKLFALLGLAGDVLAADWEILPNYNLSVNGVYHRFGLWYLTRKRNLNIFSFAAGSADAFRDALPSWVPDLRQPPHSAPLPKLDYLSNNYIDLRYDVAKEFQLRKDKFVHAIKVYHADLKYQWWGFGRAAKFSPTFIASSEGGRRLEVAGIKIGSLKALSIPYDAGTQLKWPLVILHTHHWMCMNWNTVAQTNGQNLDHPYLSSALFESAWRTMTCNMTAKGNGLQPAIYSRATRAIYDVFQETQNASWEKVKAKGDKRIAQTEIQQMFFEAFQKVASTESGMRSLLLLYESISEWQRGRRLAVTDNKFLTAVPAGAQEGDIICVFNGGRVPYVLRPAGNSQYTLVGECYVDGMMRGEVRDKGWKERKFSIC